MRIITSCAECREMFIQTNGGLICDATGKFITYPISNSCPLPSLDEKRKEAFEAGQNSVSTTIDKNGWVVLLKPDYKE